MTVAPATPADHHDLHAAFAQIVADNEGYPQEPWEPLTYAGFHSYWLKPASAAIIARVADTQAFAGAYSIKPNGVGRAAHVANAGYFVVRSCRGQGLGEALVRHSFEVAKVSGFDAMQFNLVFESNPARRLYERLGFELIGRVPEVIDGEAVLIYWRKL